MASNIFCSQYIGTDGKPVPFKGLERAGNKRASAEVRVGTFTKINCINLAIMANVLLEQ